MVLRSLRIPVTVLACSDTPVRQTRFESDHDLCDMSIHILRLCICAVVQSVVQTLAHKLTMSPASHATAADKSECVAAHDAPFLEMVRCTPAMHMHFRPSEYLTSGGLSLSSLAVQVHSLPGHSGRL